LRENSAECFARELWLFGLMAVPAGSSLCRDAREVGGLQFGLFFGGLHASGEFTSVREGVDRGACSLEHCESCPAGIQVLTCT